MSDGIVTELKSLVFGFGEFEAREDEFLLIKGGEAMPVEPKAFRVLLFLLRNPGRLVKKDEILDAVWEDVAVSENSLTRSIATLRRLLGDDAREPKYIATVQTVGYRFVCPVKVVESAADSVASKIAAVPEFQSGKKSKWRFVSIGALAAFVIALVWAGARISRHRSTTTRSAPPHFRVVPVTHLAGAVDSPAISPDGKQVAFFWEPAGRLSGNGIGHEKSGLYVQLVDGSQPLRLADANGGFIGNASWSPDGREIAFGRCGDDGAAIYTISALGGPEHKVTDVSCLYGDPGHAQWTRDGKALLFVNRCGLGQAQGIVLFSLETGQKRCITSPPPGSETDVGPVLSPDGQTVAFIRMSSSMVGDIFTVPIGGGEARRLTHENNGVWQLMWSADGRSILFIWEGGVDGLRRVPVEGGTVEKETVYPGIGSMSRDGSRLLYVEPPGFWANYATIWRADLSKPRGSAVRTEQVVASNGYDGAPQVSPDEQTLVFISGRSGDAEVWKSNADGKDPVQLTFMPGHTGTPRWSPDGKLIAFDCRPHEHSEIWMMDSNGRNGHAVTSSSSYENVVPNWSRDGKTILFASNRTGRYEVWTKDLATGRESQITTKGGFASFEAGDGKSLFFTRFDGAGIWTVPRNGGPETRLTAAPHLGYWGHFDVTDEGIYFMDSNAEDGPTIEYYDFRTKALGKVFTFPKGQSPFPWEANLSASRDGRTIYFVQGSTKSSIMMAEFGH